MRERVEEDLDDDRDDEDRDAPVSDDLVNRLEAPEERLHDDREPSVIDEAVHAGSRLLENVELLRAEEDIRRERRSGADRTTSLSASAGAGLPSGARLAFGRGRRRESDGAQRDGRGPRREERGEKVIVLDARGDEARPLRQGFLEGVLRLPITEADAVSVIVAPGLE